MEKMKENPEYQVFLQAIEMIGAQKAVGVAQAEALKNADIKYLSTNGDTPSEGLAGILSPSGLAKLGMGLDAFKEQSNGMSLFDLFKKFTALPDADKKEIVKKIDENGTKKANS